MQPLPPTTFAQFGGFRAVWGGAVWFEKPRSARFGSETNDLRAFGIEEYRSARVRREKLQSAFFV